MPKVPLSTITSGYGTVDALNQNFDAIEAAFDNTLSRDGDTPNQMQVNLDMNGFNILNQGNPITVSGFNWEGQWLTATAYQVGDVIQQAGSAYICVVAHTSGVFATDLAASRWQLVAQANLPTQTGNSGKFLTTNGTSASWDDVKYTPLGAGAIQRTAVSKLQEYVSVKDFGVIGDGIADDAPAFQAAINALPASGGTIIVPPGTYKWNSTVTIGNGTTSSASTKNNIQLIGSGGGFTTSESLAAPIQAATRIKWGGAFGGTMLQILGPISGGQLSGMMFDCSALADTAIYMMHPYTWDFSDIVVTEWRGEAWQWFARNNAPSFGVYTGSCDNTLKRIRIAGGATTTNNVCMVVGTSSGSPGDLDVCRNTFDTCIFLAPDGATNSSFVARFCDLLSFYQCFFYSPGAGLAATLRVLPPTGLTMFPSGLTFYNCSLHRKPLIDPSWNPPDVNSNGQNSGIHFYPFSSDLINEEPDYSKGIHGFTHNGMAIAKRQMKLQKGSDISETAVVVSRAVVPVTVSNTVTQTNIYSYVVPAGMVTADRRLRLKLHGVYLNNSGANRDVLFRVFLGASLALDILISGLPSSANSRAWSLQAEITSQNSVTAQFAEGDFKMGAASAAGVFSVPTTVFTGGNDGLTVNMANAQILAVAISHSAAATTISATMRGAVLELL